MAGFVVIPRRREKPLMVFDGECQFCRRWIARWRQATGDAVDYAPLQEAAAEFPEIPRGEFGREVKLIEPNGRVYGGAEAVSARCARGTGPAWWGGWRWGCTGTRPASRVDGSGLSLRRAAPDGGFGGDAPALGRRRDAPDVCQRADVVFAGARGDLLPRLSVHAFAGGRVDRQGWHPAVRAAAGGGAGALRRGRRAVLFSDALLVDRRERRRAALSL